MNEIKIDPEFRDLIPPLKPEEREQLENNIKEEGCRDALIVWNNTLIDGHNRLEICSRNNIKYKIIEKDFINRQQVINWILDNQLGRRNLTSQDRDYLLGLRYRQEKKSVGAPNGNTNRVQSPQNDAIKTSQKIANQYNVSKATVERAEKFADGVDNIAKVRPELKQEILNGKSDFKKKEIAEFANITEPEVIEKKIEEIKKPHVINNSGNNEWYTPSEYIAFARRVMGSIDCDPASSDKANEIVRSTTYYTQQDDGLTKEWKGNIWMNPPYSQPHIKEFCDKLIQEMDNKNITQAMVLVNNATETHWFQSIASKASGILFIKGRIKFLDIEGKPNNTPLQGQCILYFGDNVSRFLEVSSNLRMFTGLSVRC